MMSILMNKLAPGKGVLHCRMHEGGWHGKIPARTGRDHVTRRVAAGKKRKCSAGAYCDNLAAMLCRFERKSKRAKR